MYERERAAAEKLRRENRQISDALSRVLKTREEIREEVALHLSDGMTAGSRRPTLSWRW